MPQPDMTLYPHAPTPVNPLTAMQGIASIQSTLQENQLRQQEIKGRIAIGNIISEHTDKDGKLDAQGFLRDVSQDPDAKLFYLREQQQFNSANPLTNFMGTNAAGQPTPSQALLRDVPGVYGAAQPPNQLTGGDQQSPDQAQQQPADPNAPPNNQQPPSQDKIDEAHEHLDALDNAVTPLANDPDVNHKKVIRATADLVADPKAQFNAMDAGTVLSKLPYGQNGEPPTSDQLHQQIQPLAAHIQQQKARLNQQYPSSAQIKAKQTASELAGITPQASPVDVTVGSATGLPAGYAGAQGARQTHYNEVLDAANSAQTENAALNNVLNLSKSGAPTGTVIGDLYSYLAAHNLAPAGVESDAEKLKLIQSHASQLALAAGIPGTNEKLHAIQNAKIGDQDLPKVIQTMVPYLQAINLSKIAQAKYYNKVDPTGSDPSKIANAQLNWQQSGDPRVFEYSALPPAERAEYAKSLSPADAKEISKKKVELQKMGVLQ